MVKSSGVSRFLALDGTVLCSKPLSMRRNGFTDGPLPSPSPDNKLFVNPEAGDLIPGNADRLPAPPNVNSLCCTPETALHVSAIVAGDCFTLLTGGESTSLGDSNPVVVLISPYVLLPLRSEDRRATGVTGGLPNPGAVLGSSTTAVGPTNACTRAASRSKSSASRTSSWVVIPARELPPDPRRSNISSNCMSSSVSATATAFGATIVRLHL
mmetsp:Transcript_10349/g.38411  ORF Transcript_10349/g.38411 Transcript_10349/m.38411 type:complete len:212 (+) Transcript_10349:1296-1931(+)